MLNKNQANQTVRPADSSAQNNRFEQVISVGSKNYAVDKSNDDTENLTCVRSNYHALNIGEVFDGNRNFLTDLKEYTRIDKVTKGTNQRNGNFENEDVLDHFLKVNARKSANHFVPQFGFDDLHNPEKNVRFVTSKIEEENRTQKKLVKISFETSYAK